MSSRQVAFVITFVPFITAKQGFADSEPPVAKRPREQDTFPILVMPLSLFFL